MDAAAVGANNAAGYQLASGRHEISTAGQLQRQRPVTDPGAVPGLRGPGPHPLLLGGAGFQAQGGSREAQQIAAWVAENFAAMIDGVTVYDHGRRP